MRGRSVAAIGLVMALSAAEPASAVDKPKPAKAPTVRAALQAPAASAAASPPAAASAASVPVISEADQRLLSQFFKNAVAPRFTVQGDDLLDDELRSAALAMQAEHLPRVQALLEAWLAEELKQANPGRAFHRMQARVANELAIWGRDSTGPAQDAALAQALQRSGVCRPPGAKSGELVLRLARLRDLEPDMRREALQAERQLLARWGRPRQVDATEALDAEGMLLRVRALGQPPKKPVPPVLAQRYLGDADETRQDPLLADPATRCALHQWAGASVAQFRAAMALQAADLFWASRVEASKPASDDVPYPRLATYFHVEGQVTLQADVNAQGRMVRAKVVRRQVRVAGLGEARPFAFEGLLDAATLHRGQAMDWSTQPAKEGLRTVERDFHWGLK